MEILYAMVMLLATLMVMISLSKATDNLTWTVVQKVMKYGEDLSLSCKVENCCLGSAGWGKWTPQNEFITIFIDVKDLNVDNSSKYDGAIDKTGFSLVIRNITRDDLNSTYSCTYGFLVSKKKMLTKTDAFLDYTENTSVGSPGNSKSGTTQLAILLSLFPVAVICIVGIVVYRKKKSRKPQVGSEKWKDPRLWNPCNSSEYDRILSNASVLPLPLPTCRISGGCNSTQARNENFEEPKHCSPGNQFENQPVRSDRSPQDTISIGSNPTQASSDNLEEPDSPDINSDKAIWSGRSPSVTISMDVNSTQDLVT
ncbi:Hypothetical predicted protein [Mytilus galloprovincialis]|uniref:Ig-like domain-containing protein n=1 Tax=Mytilus galloprovincialis TaxID=29158 RepID=A0A8B6HSZ4_MYTGA|nr:Hypothetical predicted protein [Mytilus galloprovincialis]